MSNIRITGNIGKEPELRYTPMGFEILEFTVALYTGGNKQKGCSAPVWVRVSVWQELAVELSEKKLHKGMKVTVTGTPKAPRTWTNKDGVEVAAGLEINANEVAIGNLFEGDAPVAEQPGASPADMDEDIPF